MRKTLLMLGAALLVAGVAAGPVRAHHGGAAYDQTKTVTFDATVTEMQFANPHVLIFFDVRTSAGQTEKWSGWLTAPNKLSRAGWTKRTLEAGDKIKVAGTPHKEGSPVLQIRNLVGPDGKELPLFEE
jgi:hypothetical protein